MKENKRGESPILIIRWSETCNNKCVMCSLNGGDKKEESVAFENILEQLREGRENRHTNVEFTGGEPTFRPRLDEAMAYAKKIGYTQIGISTNGRMLGDRVFSENLVKNGMTDATIALHGPNAETHEKITNSPGSFAEISAGLENLKELNVHVSIDSVLCRLNVDVFEKIGDFLLEKGIDNWSISDLVPDGRGRDDYKKLAVDPEDLEGFGKRILPVLTKFSYAGIFNFSRCIFPAELPPRIVFFEIKKKMENWDMQGKAGRYSKEKTAYKDFYKKPFSGCDRCGYRDDCGGFWTDYLNIYGEEPILKIARENGFSK